MAYRSPFARALVALALALAFGLPARADTFVHDTAGHLVAASRRGITELYHYDGAGALVRRCVRQSGPSSCTRVFFDERTGSHGHVVAEQAGDSSVRYAHGPLGPTLANDGGRVLQVLGDEQASVRGLATATGQLAVRRAYEPFGATRAQAGQTSSSLGFAGESTGTSGIVWLRARSYAPELGRFLERDTVIGSPGNPKSLNRYIYAHANPLALVDPGGRTPTSNAGSSLRRERALIGTYLQNWPWEIEKFQRVTYERGIMYTSAKDLLRDFPRHFGYGVVLFTDQSGGVLADEIALLGPGRQPSELFGRASMQDFATFVAQTQPPSVFLSACAAGESFCRPASALNPGTLIAGSRVGFDFEEVAGRMELTFHADITKDRQFDLFLDGKRLTSSKYPLTYAEALDATEAFALLRHKKTIDPALGPAVAALRKYGVKTASYVPLAGFGLTVELARQESLQAQRAGGGPLAVYAPWVTGAAGEITGGLTDCALLGMAHASGVHSPRELEQQVRNSSRPTSWRFRF